MGSVRSRRAKAWWLGCVLIALAACTEPESRAAGARDEAAPAALEGEAVPEVLEGINPVWRGDLDGMLERKLVRAAVTFSLTNYFLDGAHQKGISYETLQLFEKELNKKFDTGRVEVDVVIIPVARDRLLPALLEGRADLALANLTITPERQELVDFSTPVYTGVSEVVVTGPDTEPVERLEDLSGREVVVRASSSYYESLRALNQRFEQQGIAPVELTPADEHLEAEDLLEMVNAGLIPMTVVDSYLADFWSQVFTDITVRYDVTVAEGEEIAWAFRKDSPKLRAFVDPFIREHRRQGTLIGNILFRRYLRSTRWAEKSLSDEGRERFQRTLGLFRKYGERYEIPWLMLAAVAYQESRLDQGLRSRHGAVGIMQLLPSTAADPNVGIPHIEILENNIHAGAKYLAFLRARYFSGEEMDDLNQWLFTLAAYNSGPRRVAGLRQGASAMKLDPDEWFQNVEVVAAREIGREPVRYVANIYKYYIAYSRIAAELEKKRS